MKPEDRKEVIDALRLAIEVSYSEANDVRFEEALAIMRKEPEPINPHHPQYVEGFKAGHAAGRLRGRAEKKEPEPISDAEIERLAVESGIYDCIRDPYDKFKTGDDYGSVMYDLKRFARALLEKAR